MKPISVALVGNPNSGKTTLINRLTGSQLQVGNWPGVTVERKSGLLSYQQHQIQVVDLPGIYSLTTTQQDEAVDTAVTNEYLRSNPCDVYLNVVDAANLERNLYLTTQLLSLGKPVIVVLSKMDIALQQGVQIDTQQLSQQLHCPVIAANATRKQEMQTLKDLIVQAADTSQTTNTLELPLPAVVREAVSQVTQMLSQQAMAATLPSAHVALCLLEDDAPLAQQLTPAQRSQLANIQASVQAQADDTDILIAESRYQFIHQVTTSVLKQQSASSASLTQAIDKVVLHRWLGIPIFLLVMYCMFVFAINVGGVFQDFFENGSEVLFVDGVAQLLSSVAAPEWLIAIVAQGIGKGISTVLSFIPVIGAMFLFLALLEGSGYIARAAFVMDKFMQSMGLPGKSFVPMIVGFGCNVPAIMGARTMDSQRDRILTIMMTPFMSCGARLAIFVVFAAAFFPQGGQNIVFVLYLIGIAMAMLTGLLLRNTMLSGQPAPFIMELPRYQLPQVSFVLRNTWQRLQSFIVGAGKVILPVCVVLMTLSSISTQGSLLEDESEASMLSSMAKKVTPIFAPMGIEQDNWPATVGLLTGMLAKEVVVGTLNTLYTQQVDLSAEMETEEEGEESLWSGLQQAVLSIPENARKLPQALFNPIAASAPDEALSQEVYGVMYQYFRGPIAAFAYLLFVLLYVPCISTVAVVAKELNKTWAVFSVAWSTLLAYAAAVSFYQLATWHLHPWQSVLWVSGMLGVLASVFFILRRYNTVSVNHSLLSTEGV
jgi:ferrous iron transport protein B